MHLQINIYRSFLVLIANFVLVTFCFGNPPATVWRADTRAPDVIFKQGFSSYANNLDYIQHILGKSCIARTSAFISTTANQNMANQWALYGLKNPRLQLVHFYIYEIRATNNFYNAVTTLDHLAKTPHLASAFEFNNARKLAITQAEYSALTRIEPEQIRKVTVLSLDRQGRPVKSYLNNPNYVPADTHANTGPFNGSDQFSPENLSRPMVTGKPPATACFLSPGELAKHLYFHPFLLNSFWIDDSITG